MATDTTQRRDWVLTLCALFGPAAWAVFIAVNYALEDPLACSPGASVKGQILGVGVRTIAAGVSLALGGATLLVGALSLVLWLALRDTNSSGRRPWMALAGVLNSALFGIVILVGVAPAVILRTCAPSP